MKPDEIRKKYSGSAFRYCGPSEELVCLQVEMLVEIAAQLAEANALVRFELGLEDEMSA